MSNGRWGTGEEGERAEHAGNDRRGQRLQRCNDGDRRNRRGGRLVLLDGYMSGGTERAVRVGVGSVGVGVRYLGGAGDDHQKDTEDGKEVSPRAASVLPLRFVAHARPTI